jgi:ABC-type Fe3+-hydroxamate transport system substrate-binding protein
MEWSEREWQDAGIVTMRKRLDLPIGSLDPREIRALIRKVGDLQKAVAQRDALINLYQSRVEALSAELQGRGKRGWLAKLLGR